MIDQYKIIEKVTELLEASPDLDDVTIRQSEPINNNPDQAPWIGVYPDAEIFTPAYLGGIDSWEREIGIRVAIQVANSKDGPSAEVTMSGYIKAVIKATYANTKAWVNLLDRISEIRVEHGFTEDDQGTMMFRESTVIFTATASSGVK